MPADYQIDQRLGENYAAGSGFGLEEIDLDQSNRILEDEMRRRGLRVIDLTGELREAFLSGHAPYLLLDRHLSEAGHRVVVDKVFPVVQSFLSKPGT